MSFHFQKLEIKDWLVYGQTNTLEFPDFEPGKNLVIIHGKNGFGKTSLLRALQFLFHNGLSRDELFDTWHQQAADEGEGSLEVRLEFIHQERLCKLIRSAEFKPWHRGSTAVSQSVRLWIDNEEEEHQVEDKIAQMIPEECQQFVLFDGAEITRYAQKQHESGVKDAIERMLGIPAVRNLRDDLERLIKDLENQQAEILLATNKNQSLVFQIERLQEEEASYLERKTEFEEKVESIQNSLRELEKETAQIQAIEAERAQLADKLARHADYEERRKQVDNQIADLLKLAPIYMLMDPLSQIVAEVSAKQTIPKRQRYLLHQKEFLETLLEQESCVCGQPVVDSVEEKIKAEIERLTKLTSMADGKPAGASGSNELIQLSTIVNKLRQTPLTGQDLMDTRSTIDEKIEEIDKEISDLKERLKGHELVEVQELYAQKEQLERQLTDAKTSLMAVENNLRRVKNEMADRQRELDQLVTDTDKGKGLTQTLKETRKLHQAISDYVDQLALKKRRDIEEIATRIFTDITNKPIEYAGVRVRDDYTLEVYRQDDSVVGNERLSAGEKEVLAYSFITALNLSSPDPAPFVMDTPFGHLDSSHRDGLLKSLPNLQVQVFLLATDRDLPPTEQDRIQSAVAKAFAIQRNQRQATSYFEEI